MKKRRRVMFREKKESRKKVTQKERRMKDPRKKEV